MHMYVKTVAKLREFMHMTEPHQELYIDIETYANGQFENATALDTRTAVIRLITVGVSDGMVATFDLLDGTLTAPVIDFLRGKVLIGHNLAYDLACLYRYGLDLAKIPAVRDTFLGSQVLTAGLNVSHSLGECVSRYLERSMDKSQGASDWSFPDLSLEQIEYAYQDVLQLIDLDQYLNVYIADRSLTATYQLECQTLLPVIKMGVNGVAVNVPVWKERSLKAAAEVERLVSELDKLLPPPPTEAPVKVRHTVRGVPFKVDLAKNQQIAERNETRRWNYGSPKQVMEAFSLLGFTIPDTSYETLQTFKELHHVFEVFLDYRDHYKEATTYGEAWLKYVINGRIHPKWWQMGTRSGRMSCSEQNMQQVPARCRSAIYGGEGRKLIRADFSQIEARVAAKISDDEVLIELFRDPAGDIHTYTARKVLGKENITKADRQTGKSLVFGLLFGMSAPSLRNYCKFMFGVKLSEHEAALFRERFFDTYQGLARWHRKVREDAKRVNSFRTLLGRRRIITPDIENVFGIGTNHPVQGTAADMMKSSVVRLWHDQAKFPDAKLVMLVHDELVYEAPAEIAQDVASWVHDHMVTVGNEMIYPVPVEASVKVQDTWG